jgi:hypothetical protein
MNNLYNTISKLDSKSTFNYFIIIIIFLFITNNMKIKLNHVVGLLLGTIFVLFKYQNNMNNLNQKDNQIIEKIKIIDNNNKNRKDIGKIKDYQEIVDFLFSINEFYKLNQETFEDLIDNLNNFLLIYENIKIDNINYTEKYIISENIKNNIMNILHSFIYSIGNHYELVNKLNYSCNVLNKILNKYLEELYDICQKKLIIYGYNINTKQLYNGPKKYNIEENNKFTYKLY